VQYTNVTDGKTTDKQIGQKCCCQHLALQHVQIKVASNLRSERPTSTPSEMTPIHIVNGTADFTNFSKSAAVKAAKSTITT